MNLETAEFIRTHARDDVRELALRGTKNPAVNLPFALDQIAGRQMAQQKLPSWASVDGVIYPSHLSMEQCSSEQTARYKARLLTSLFPSPQSFADLTGGFGVDFFFMSQTLRRATYVERQEHLCETARQNFKTLNLDAQVVCADGTDYLRTMNPVDVIFMDPARRDDHGARTYGISDCTPDVMALRPLLMAKAKMVIIKLSPMLDWRKAVADLGEQLVSEVHIVSVGNECKELLLVLKSDSSTKGELVCVNDDSRFEVPLPLTHVTPQPCGAVVGGLFLYEPNASIMKAGCFAEVSARFGVAPLAPNSHLFVSGQYVGGFPGRTFSIEAVTSFNKRELRARLRDIKQANLSVRNFPMSVAELRKRLKISEGGSNYLFATTLASGNRVLLICQKATGR
jgi:hypothetical protein